MREGLIGAAHDAESNVSVASFHETRDDGVIRTFAPREDIGMGGIERETGASILEHETHAFNRDSRTEIAEDALNPTHDISLAVGYRQIGGIASGYLSGAH